nr:hypothetical protein CRG98_000308 [Ipomoea batatas]
MILWKEMADGHSSGLNLKHLESQMLRIPSRSIFVANHRGFNLSPIRSDERNRVSLGEMVYFCMDVWPPAAVDIARTFFPSLDLEKSTMDSNEVAHCFSSPLITGSSHSVMVCFITWASSESGAMENWFRIWDIFWEENGIFSASERGKKVASFAVLVKRKVMVLPLCKAVGLKKRATLGSSWS